MGGSVWAPVGLVSQRKPLSISFCTFSKCSFARLMPSVLAISLQFSRCFFICCTSYQYTCMSLCLSSILNDQNLLASLIESFFATLLAIPVTFSALVSDSLYPSPQGLLSRFHPSPMMSYWKRVDERFIKRGMLIMDLDFLRNYQDELIRMNRKKSGRPYRTAESYVMFLAVIRYLIIQIP